MIKSLNCLVSKQGFNARLNSAVAFWLEINRTDTFNFVNSQWVISSSSKTFKTLNPDTGEVVSEIQDGNETHVDKAVMATKKAFKLDSPWRSINPSKPRVLLNKLADFMKRDTVHLTSLKTSDYSKRYTASYSVDVASSVQKGNLIAFKRAHRIPHGLISKLQIRTNRNFSTVSVNGSSNNIIKSTINDPDESLDDLIKNTRLLDDWEDYTFTTSSREWWLELFSDPIQRLETENDSSKRLELCARALGKIECMLYTLPYSRDEADQKLRKSVQAEHEWKIAINTQYFVRCCAAMEKFELQNGESAVIDYESLPKNRAWTEKSVLIRALHYKWIFANKSDKWDYRVKTLLKKVKNSKKFDSVAEFCRCIAVAYQDLSRTVRELTLTPCLKDPKYSCIVTTPKAKEAVSIFMSMFVFNDYIGARKNPIKEKNDPGKSIIGDPEKNFIFTTSVEDTHKIFKDLIQPLETENDPSKRSELCANLLDKVKMLVYADQYYRKKTEREIRNTVRVEHELEAIENTLFFVRWRAAIETFESDYSSSAVIDCESFPEDLPFIEENVLIRTLQYEWIFANRSEECKVKTLLELVNDSKEFDSLSEFCKCIAVVHMNLSRTIQILALMPILKDAEYRCVTTNPKASKALSIFMSAFQVNDSVAVNKVSDQEKLITQKLIYAPMYWWSSW
ncbi:uncharacterized protein LOC135840215 [Planococcus citri]|uniref:uncharacterized protein LOC135840215 n=1 Tax=Planococcus citri TaxID=170843 RepID=UPI0031F93AEF